MRNKRLLDKIAHRYGLNGIELDDKVISMCNSLKESGMYRIHWSYDNIVTRIEKLEGYSYYKTDISYGHYNLINHKNSKALRLVSTEFIDLDFNEIRNDIIDEIFKND